MSKMPDVQEQRNALERKDCRKYMRPGIILLGCGVNNDMTVIARWRAIEVYRKEYFETAHPAVSFIYAKHYQTNANI